jgi:hypothetical protein
MPLTPEQDKKFREELEAKEKEQKERPDIVLSIKIKPDNQMEWVVPTNLITASYLLKVLDVAVSKQMEANIREGLKPKENIRKKILGVF